MMTKKEEELKTIQAFGFKVGDKIRWRKVIYEIVEKEEYYILHPVDNKNPNLLDVSSMSEVLRNFDWKKVVEDHAIDAPVYALCNQGETND